MIGQMGDMKEFTQHATSFASDNPALCGLLVITIALVVFVNLPWATRQVVIDWLRFNRDESDLDRAEEFEDQVESYEQTENQSPSVEEMAEKKKVADINAPKAAFNTLWRHFKDEQTPKADELVDPEREDQVSLALEALKNSVRPVLMGKPVVELPKAGEVNGGKDGDG